LIRPNKQDETDISFFTIVSIMCPELSEENEFCNWCVGVNLRVKGADRR